MVFSKRVSLGLTLVGSVFAMALVTVVSRPALFEFFFRPKDSSAQSMPPANPSAALFDSVFCTPGGSADLVATNTGSSSPINIVVQTGAVYAGAISSLKINGEETVNNYDHGRQLQYALSADKLGECYNPTEAGTRADGSICAPPTSQFIEGCASGNKLYTKSKMGYWIAPGTQSTFCTDNKPGLAQNTSVVSGYELSKVVEVGIDNMPNVVKITAKLHVPENRSVISLEQPSGHYKSSLDLFALFNVLNKTLTTPNTTPLWSSFLSPVNRWDTKSWPPIIPVVMNNKYAISTYVPDVRHYQIVDYPGEGELGVSKTAIWGLINNVTPGDYYFTSYLAISNPQDVRADLTALTNAFPPNNLPPVGNIDSISTGGLVTGWAGDSDYTGNSSVNIYLDGPPGQGTKIGTVTTSLSRSDVLDAYKFGATSGFTFQIPSSALSGGQQHSVYISTNDYYVNNSTNEEKLVAGGVLVPATFNAPAVMSSLSTNATPQGWLDGINSSGLANGWAADRNGEPINVEFYMDGIIGTGTYIGSTLANLNRPSVPPIIGYGTYVGYNFQIPSQYGSDGKQHKLYAYSVDLLPNRTNGARVLLGGSNITIPAFTPGPAPSSTPTSAPTATPIVVTSTPTSAPTVAPTPSPTPVPTLAPTPSPTPVSTGVVISNAGVATQYNPWYGWAVASNLSSTMKARLIDVSGAQWGVDIIAGVAANKLSLNFRFPSNKPPSNCNVGKSCVIGLYLVSPNGALSNKYNYTIPPAP